MFDIKKTLAKMLGQCEFKTLLWENPNPSSAFAAQTVSLDLSKYDAVEICAKSASTISPVNYIKIGTDEDTYIDMPTNKFRRRRAYCNSSGIVFDAGEAFNSYNSAATADNTIAVPVKIYGIKFAGGGIS